MHYVAIVEVLDRQAGLIEYLQQLFSFGALRIEKLEQISVAGILQNDVEVEVSLEVLNETDDVFVGKALVHLHLVDYVPVFFFAALPDHFQREFLLRVVLVVDQLYFREPALTQVFLGLVAEYYVSESFELDIH